jgi:hypothetical protein
MRDKDWLLKVIEEASERVKAWPDWKKSSDLRESMPKKDNAVECPHCGYLQ